MGAKVMRITTDQDLQRALRSLESRGARIIAAVPRGTPVDLIYREADLEDMGEGATDADVEAFRSV